MKKRVVIVHGWDGHPEEGWFPWLKNELESRGYEVVIPQLPGSDNPRIHTWVPALRNAVRVPDEHTYLVGHSMGCQAIVRYLEVLPGDTKIGGAVFVAGFFKRLKGLEDDPGVQETAHHWLGTSVDLNKAKKHIKKSIAIFSDNDPYVSMDNQDDFKNLLGSKIIVEHHKGHFSGGMDNCVELPVALDAVLEIAGEDQ